MLGSPWLRLASLHSLVLSKWEDCLQPRLLNQWGKAPPGSQYRPCAGEKRGPSGDSPARTRWQDSREGPQMKWGHWTYKGKRSPWQDQTSKNKKMGRDHFKVCAHFQFCGVAEPPSLGGDQIEAAANISSNFIVKNSQQSAEFMWGWHHSWLLVSPPNLPDFSGNPKPIAWKQRRNWESERWTVELESKQQDLRLYKDEIAFGVTFHTQRALPLLSWCGCLWNSLGPAVMESCREGAGVA